MHIKSSPVWLILLVSMLFLSGCGESLETHEPPTSSIKPSEPDNTDDSNDSDDSDTLNPPQETGDIQTGEELYKGAELQCSTCHDDEGSSPAFPINSNKQTYSHSSEPDTALSLSDYLDKWMPTGDRTSCTDECAQHVAAYIRSWNPVNQTPDEESNAGEDDNSDGDPLEETDIIENQAPLTSFSRSGDILTATSTDDNGFANLTHQWFVDNVLSGEEVTFNTSSLLNTVTIKLISTDAQNLSNSKIQDIDFTTINAAPVASFSQSGDTLTATSTDDSGFANLTHQWFVNDISKGTGTIFDASGLSGTNTIKLVATDAQVIANSTSQTIDFGNTIPVARATANITSGEAPLTVIFDGSTSSDTEDTALTYLWTFSDGTSSTQESPSKTFDTANNYTATLTVADSVNGMHTAAVINITATEPTTPLDPDVLTGNSITGATLYASNLGCATCHGADGQTPLGTSPIIDADKAVLSHRSASGVDYSLAQYINLYMPPSTPNTCDAQCAADIASYIRTWNNVVVDPTDSVPAVTVSGNKVVFGGEEKSLAGYSLFWSNTGWGGEKFYTTESVAAVKNDLNGNIIRAAMGVDESGGYLESDANKVANQQRVETVVDAAIDNDMYVLIDWHTHHAEDYKAEAIEFFTAMATKYGNEPNVIYEIYNEPLAVSWSNVIKPYALDVIAAIRAIDPDNLIIVGTPNWSQDVDDASLDPITTFDNIAYTLHFYAGTHKAELRAKATTAINNGLPLFVTEWGSVDASGDGGVDAAETQLWMDFVQTNKISHLNWALNDKEEGSSVLVPNAGISDWSNADLTASGTLVADNAANWPDTIELGNPDPIDPIDPIDPDPIDPIDPNPVDPVDPNPVDPVDPGDIVGDTNNGEVLYASTTLGCTSCHGIDGVSGPFASIDSDKKTYTPADAGGLSYSLAQYINLYMPQGGVGKCDEQCAADIASYIGSWNNEPDIIVQSCDIDDAGINYGRRQMRLLTALEYKNSLHDLVGFDIDPSNYGIPADTLVESFANQVLTPVTQNYMDAYVSTANAAAEYAEINNFAGVADCTGLSTSACAELFVNDFAVRAYRRPLTDAEVTRYRSLFTGSLSEGKNSEALKLAISAALGSPHFLYRSEMGEKVSDIIDRIDNGDPVYASGNVGLTLSGDDINAGDDGFRVVPLYNNIGMTLPNYTFTDHNIVTIVAKGVDAGGLPNIELKVDNKTIDTIQLISADTNTYSFIVEGVNGNNKYMQVTNANTAAHNEGRVLSVQSISISDSVLVVEDRPDAALDDDAYILSPYEMATFLSYTYSGSTPDAELMLAASNKELDTPQQLQAQITRLLATEKARIHFGEFSAQWLNTDKVLSAAKSAELYPTFTTDIRKAMAKENREIFKHVMFDDNQPVTNLFNNFSFMNNELAGFYGVTGPSGTTFEKVSELSGRGGILTSGAFMAGFAHADETSPIKRAVAVRERMLCQAVPPMPTDIEAAREDAEIALAQYTIDQGGLITNRQHYAFITKDEPCSACHEEIINPHAFGMEDFDPVGKPRVVGTNGLAIDAEGQLIGTKTLSDGNVLPFYGARDFSDNLQTLPTINTCFTEKGFRFVMGIGHEYFDHLAEDAPELAADEKAGYNCALDSMNKTMAEANNNAKSAFLALGVLDIVRYRKQR
ncbi:cellulase family glycosylhydrolase [Colwellia sp. E2M01]|uniref:cellulase family glycosylhydrolase n=1 Tax=Colwellia sp. E2M01 TaxID=2841561 RepID=UPI001C09C7E1|nr:cellulase family glycosylhydrolase [Colwellia sp. E2M01]MBU2870666.1 cellulase family glycosylhydrolase [Colwellia sp. E2M01]